MAARYTPSLPCVAGCKCAKHFRHVRQPHTEESKLAMSRAKIGTTFPYKSRAPLTQEHRTKIANSVRTTKREAIARNPNIYSSLPGSGKTNFSGGNTGRAFAAILCPLGYVREYILQWGLGRSDRYNLDFALLDAKVNIELDGPYHMSSTEEDDIRDARLRALGWKVIRVTHK